MNIKTITALPLAIILSVAAALIVVVTLQTATVHAADKKDDQKKSDTKKDDDKKVTTYSYVAQPGDSYSKLARKAVQTYAKANKIDLSNSRVLYAETNLTQAAKSPQLLQGQKVEIPEATAKNWVTKAKDLKSDQAAKWDKYTAGVNFDTSKVGVSQ